MSERIETAFHQMGWDQHREMVLDFRQKSAQDSREILRLFDALADQIEAGLRQGGALLVQMVAEATALNAQKVLSGEIGSNQLVWYYKIRGRYFPRYMGGRHLQSGNLARSIHAMQTGTHEYAVGTNLDYGYKIAKIDRQEVGKDYLERGYELALLDYFGSLTE